MKTLKLITPIHTKSILFLIFYFMISQNIEGQTLDKLAKPKDAVKVSGGLNYSMNFMDSYGKPLGRDPLNWVLSGNVNVSILDVALPFTYTFTNQGGAYTQPFNIVALHPSYKKFKSHIGNFSTSISPYSLSGLTIAGGGIEYSPGKWKLQAVGGRFQKSVAFDNSLNNYQTLAYTRWGGGLSVGFDNKGYSAQFVFMKAQDDPNSLLFVPSSATVTPKDNVVSSIKLKGTFFKSLTAEVETATSILNRDRRNENALSGSKFTSFFGKLVNGNQTTDNFTAINANLSYKFKVFSIGSKYERIDPGYQTLGGLFFNNDLENITLTPTASLLKGKLNINANVGVQRNNLASTASSESRRWIGTVGISGSPIKNLNLSVNYSNMSSFSRRNPAVDPFYNVLGDTLNVYQISSSGAFTSAYSFGKTNKQNFVFSSTVSVSENITGRLENAAAFGINTTEEGASIPTKVYTGMLGHTLSFSKSKLNMGWTFNSSLSRALGNETVFAGPGINCSKPFPKKKLNLSSGLVYNQNYLNGHLQTHVLNARLGLGYQPQWWDKKYGTMSMNLSSSLVTKLATNSSTVSSSTTRDFMLLFSVSYGF